MDLKPTGVIEMRKHANYGCIINLIEWFDDSEHKCVELRNFTHKSVDYCIKSVDRAITKLHKYNGMIVMKHEGKIYLVKI